VTILAYAHAEVLVDTQWVEDHLKDQKVRIAEVDYDPKANYMLGHAPETVLFDWKQDINDPISRNKKLELMMIQFLYFMEILTIGLRHLHFGSSSIMVTKM